MARSETDWIYDSNKEDLYRYLEDGIDLSPTVNSGQRIADLRGLAEISVAELSAKCSISVQELLALESGMMSLKSELAILLAKELGVGLSDLYLSDE